jgi:TolB-like protein
MRRPLPVRSFLAELKRRHVFRVVAGYSAIAFAAVSVASDFLPALRLPGWTVTLVAALAVLGFPVAVVLAWLFVITPGGVQRDQTESPAGTGADGGGGLRVRSRRRTAAYVGLGLLAAATAVGAVSQIGGLRLLTGAKTIPSVAVLPFKNITDGPKSDYFSAGIHEDVLTQLYKLGGMTVISRTSVMPYRETTKSIRTIAEELQVSTILEASVRRIDNRVRIDARLIDAATDRQIWAESYERELRDVLAMQAEIAQEIAGALQARLSPDAQTRLAAAGARTVDPAMYEEYLRGLFEAGQGRDSLAVEAFRRALRIDPGYAPAHAGMARSYYTLGFFGHRPPAEAFSAMYDAATTALDLDSDLADAHATLALYYLHFRWDWALADEHFRRALRLSPNHAQVRHDYAHYLLAVGRVDESVKESADAATLDPSNMMLRACSGWHGFTNHEYADAVTRARSALMMMPSSYWPQIILGWAHLHEGRSGEALKSLESAVDHSGGSPFAVASLAGGLAVAGERTPARRMLDELLAQSAGRYVSAYDVAAVHAGLGDHDQAVSWLRRAYSERSAMLVNVGWDPRFDAIRPDPRFQAILADVGLPDRPRPAPATTPPRKRPIHGM